MADRPRGDRGEESDDFDWLYPAGKRPAEDATRPVRKQPPAEEQTRVMRAQPRQSQARPPVPPSPPPVAPPPGGPSGRPPSDGPGRPRRSRAKLIRRVVLLLLAAWVVYLVAVPVMVWTQVNKVAFEPAGDRPDDQPGTTYLLVGSDSRAGLTKKQQQRLGTGGDIGARTDTIMLLHTGSGPNLLMSIPRDSQVEIPGHGTSKINAAFAYGGAELLAQTIEHNTDIRIDQYAEIGMGGVISIVNAVGGITVCPKQDMKDPLANNLDITKGCQEVGGATALGYARSRKTSSLGDIDRAARQREVVSAVGKKALSPWTVINPVRYWKLNHSVPDSFAFGEGASPFRAAMWAMAMTRVNGEAGLTCGIPIADMAVNWDDERAEQMFEYIRTDSTDDIPKSLCTPSGLPKSVTG